MVYRTPQIARNGARLTTRAAFRKAPWLLFFLVVAGLFAVGDPPRAPRTSVEDGSVAALTAPPGLRAAYIATRQAEGARDPHYAFRADPSGATFSAQTAGGLRAAVASDGVGWAPQDAPWRAHLAAVRYGCSGELAEVDRSSPPALDATPNRVGVQVYAGNAALEEWYVNGPLGLDQGWTLRDSACAGDDTELEVAVRGLEPAEASQGPGIDLRDAAGTTRLHYSDLSARDADGKALASSMEVADGRIVVHVQTRGARFPVVIDPLTWPSPKVLQVTTLASNSYFGSSIAVSGNTAIIGASQATSGDGTPHGGVIYYYSFSTTTGWTLQQTIQPPAASNMGQFGIQIAVSGSVMAVATFISSFQGGVYVYTLSGNVWSVTGSVLTAPDGGSGDGFGANGALAVSGTTVFVGASSLNAAYVFNQSGGTWADPPSQELTSGDSTAQAFGGSLAVSGNTLIVGAFNSTGSLGQGSGAAYAFTLSGSTWTKTATLLPPGNDLGTNSGLGAGTSVAIAGSTVFVGAPYAPVGNVDTIGAVYVYTQSGTTFGAPSKVSATDVPVNGGFGNSIAASGPNLVVGTQNSKIYVFTGSGSNWTQALEIGEPNGSTMDLFGGLVGASGPNLLVGASCYLESGGNCGSGAVYAGLLASTTGSSCSTGSDCQSTFCVSSVCCSTACTGACATGCATGACGTAGSGTACGGGYVCNGSSQACPTSCAADTNCIGTDYCAANGTCQPRKATGATCNTAAGADCLGASCHECATGGCVDGFCCSTASCGGCMACAASLTGGTNGTCSNVLVGNDPHGECGATMTCNGANACGLKTGQSSTVASACATGDAKDGFCCNAACSNSCQVCSAALGASANGTCTTAPMGYAGNPACGSGIACTGLMNANTCPGTACTSDANCVAGYYCASTGTAGVGSCQLQRTKGAVCNIATGGDCESPPCSECGGSTCVDSVCCGSSSCPACEACSTALAPGGTNGTCSPVTKGTDPHTSCNGSTQTCNGSGACALKNGQAATLATACASGNLANGVCCNTACGVLGCDVCTAALGTSPDGTCGAAKAGSVGAPSCSPLVCDGSGETCPTTCAGDDNCASGFYCGSDKTCHARKGTGSTCNVGTASAPADCAQGGCHECANGGCVDGVCCSTPSCGACEACAASLTGGTNGTCSHALVGSDPHGDCASTSTCNGSGVCGLKNGQGSTSANACASGNLADGVCCSTGCGAACQQCTAFGSNPAGTCAPLPSGSAGTPACGAVVCDGTHGTCPGASCASDADCAAGFYCGTGSGTTGTCQPQRSQGIACNVTAGANGDCFTANCHECGGTTSCVDNVCCGSSSCGACESCSAALQVSSGTAGMCGPSLAGTDPHSDCSSGSTCNGSGACGLANGQPATSASACSSGNLSDGVCCDLPCLGSCAACTVAHGATKDGSCTTLPDGTACNGAAGTCQAANCVVPEDAGATDAAVATIEDGSVSADGSPRPQIADASSSDSASRPMSDAAIPDAASGQGQMMADASDVFERKTPNCSCRVAGTPSSKTPGLAAFGAVAVALMRRRRRRSARFLASLAPWRPVSSRLD
jgi:hypothetical protein